jgi:hypothetical protein
MERKEEILIIIDHLKKEVKETALKHESMLGSIIIKNGKLIETVPELLETIYHGLRLAKSLPNKESIGVRMFIKAAEKVLKKALT